MVNKAVLYLSVIVLAGLIGFVCGWFLFGRGDQQVRTQLDNAIEDLRSAKERIGELEQTNQNLGDLNREQGQIISQLEEQNRRDGETIKRLKNSAVGIEKGFTENDRIIRDNLEIVKRIKEKIQEGSVDL